MSDLEIPEGFELVSVPLHAVQFDKESAKRKVCADGHTIDFYAAEADQFVKAYVDGKLAWMPVSGYSVHAGVKVVIIDLANGGQIISDHDPRAVFGRAAGEEEPRRFYPDEALRLGVRVPCEIPLGMARWENEALFETYGNLWSALGAQALLLTERRLSSLVGYDGSNWTLTSNELTSQSVGVEWVLVSRVQYTDQQETGCDLTVPGYETFTSLSGVVLSNTMSVHLPSTPEAVKDVRDKLMPSNMAWSIKDRTKTLANPKHEMLIGLGMGQTAGGTKRKFATDDEAMQAISDGSVNINDDIEITG
jgi:hypothetical protein